MPMGDPPAGSYRIYDDGTSQVFTGERWVELPRYAPDWESWHRGYNWALQSISGRDRPVIRGERVDFVWVDEADYLSDRTRRAAPIMDIEPEDL